MLYDAQRGGQNRIAACPLGPASGWGGPLKT